MKFFMIGPYYLYWHYTRGFTELSRNLYNFIVFEFHFFSVKDLLLTLFSPFQRLKENYGSSIMDFENIAASFVTNVVMRIVGLCIRSVILLVAFIVILCTCVIAPILVLIWSVLPLVLFVFLFGSIWAYITYKP